MRQESTTRTSHASVSAALAAANAAGPISARFPGEDGGHSLAEMAQRDLDAALQLLADRAQYITGAGGAAIALRRAGKNDLLCRASSGSNAPELGALLSTEFGLSGESVRTRRALRCDDAERDARVNREVCRELGIASVVVMPVVDDDQVLGVFELFSGKANAFGERDLTALERLSQMVETAVRLARAAETVPEKMTATTETTVADADHPVVEVVTEAASEPVRSRAETSPAQVVLASSASQLDPPKANPVTKPLFWSVALSAVDEAEQVAGRNDRSHVPPGLRNLQKCEACGFPVSPGRALCVECEEKKWRGQLKRPNQQELSRPTVKAANANGKNLASVEPRESTASSSKDESVSGSAAEQAAPIVSNAKAKTIATVAERAEEPAEAVAPKSSSPEFVLSAGLAPSQSWIGRNKYVIAVILVVAAAVAAFVFLR